MATCKILKIEIVLWHKMEKMETIIALLIFTYIQSIQKMSEQEKVGSKLTVKWQETCQTGFIMEIFFENMSNLT